MSKINSVPNAHTIFLWSIHMLTSYVGISLTRTFSFKYSHQTLLFFRHNCDACYMSNTSLFANVHSLLMLTDLLVIKYSIDKKLAGIDF